MSHEQLIQSITVLNQACSAELSNDAEEAMELYLAAAGQLSSSVECLPPECGDVVKRTIEEVRIVLDNLRQVRWMKEQPKFFPTFPVQFARVPIPAEQYAIPSSPFHRVLWLMRQIKKSMQRGAYITPSIYVLKDVWLQDGGGQCLRHIGAKQRFLSSISKAIQPLLSLNSLADAAEVVRLLKQFDAFIADRLRELHDEMGAQSNLPERKHFWSSFHKSFSMSDKEVKYEQFVATVVTLFDQCQLFERLYMYFSQLSTTETASSEIISVLNQIGKSLYRGPCVCVVRDMMTLVERFHHKGRRSVCALLPVDPKLIVDEC